MTLEIVTRAQWGARYRDGFRAAPIPAREVWLHHSVTATPPPNRDAEIQAMRILENIGEQRFGGGISYTFAVMPSGTVFQGHSVNREGAHTKGRNSIARAIVLVGNYDVLRPSGAQIQAVGALLRSGASAGWFAAAKLNGGHRNAPGASTACPGRFGMDALAAMNSAAGNVAPQPPPQPPGGSSPWASWPTLAFGATGAKVSALQAFLRRVFPSYAGTLPATGNFLHQTQSTVREFQKKGGPQNRRNCGACYVG